MYYTVQGGDTMATIGQYFSIPQMEVEVRRWGSTAHGPRGRLMGATRTCVGLTQAQAQPRAPSRPCSRPPPPHRPPCRTPTLAWTPHA